MQQSMDELNSIDELISEKDVYERFPKVFADKELREARQSGQIEYYLLRMGPHYSEKQLIAYVVKRLRKPCQNRPLAPEETEPGNSESNGSARKRPHLTSIATGTPRQTVEDDALIARALERRT